MVVRRARAPRPPARTEAGQGNGARLKPLPSQSPRFPQCLRTGERERLTRDLLPWRYLAFLTYLSACQTLGQRTHPLVARLPWDWHC